jgi:hypothetical protein
MRRCRRRCRWCDRSRWCHRSGRSDRSGCSGRGRCGGGRRGGSRCGRCGDGGCRRRGGSRNNRGDGRYGSGRCDNRPARGGSCRSFGGWTTGDEPCSGPLDRSGRSRGRTTHVIGGSRPRRSTFAVSVIGLIRAGQPSGCRRFFGRGLLRRGCRLFGLYLSTKPFTISLTTGAVRLSVLDGR